MSPALKKFKMMKNSSGQSLAVLERELEPQGFILFSGPRGSIRHFLNFEVSGSFVTGNATICALFKVIERLSPASRKLWDASRKVFSIGYGIKSSTKMLGYTISHDVVERIAAIGGEVGVTFYNEVNSGSGKELYEKMRQLRTGEFQRAGAMYRVRV